MKSNVTDNEQHTLRVETESWLEWRSALKRLYTIGYHWVSQSSDKWHDDYFWNENARVLYLDIRYKTITRGGLVDPFKLGKKVNIKEVKN